MEYPGTEGVLRLVHPPPPSRTTCLELTICFSLTLSPHPPLIFTFMHLSPNLAPCATHAPHAMHHAPCTTHHAPCTMHTASRTHTYHAPCTMCPRFTCAICTTCFHTPVPFNLPPHVNMHPASPPFFSCHVPIMWLPTLYIHTCPNTYIYLCTLPPASRLASLPILG